MGLLRLFDLAGCCNITRMLFGFSFVGGRGPTGCSQLSAKRHDDPRQVEGLAGNFAGPNALFH